MIKSKLLYLVLCLFVIIAAEQVAAGYEYEAGGKRDPFIPLLGMSEKTSVSGVLGIISIEDAILQGIVKGNEGLIAIINGEMMKENDVIGRVTIVSVKDNEVTVKVNENVHVLKLYE